MEQNVASAVRRFLVIEFPVSEQSSESGVVLLAAVSGGADSMAMLSALCKLRADESCSLHCLHVEHGLRSAQESRGDAEFVRSFCEKHQIDCHVVHIPPGKIAAYAKEKGAGIAAAARYFRHKALYKEAERLGQNTVILLAHTNDDVLETALMRTLRGAGPSGLASMPVSRTIQQGKSRIFRPLLYTSRAEIIEYLNAKNIFWREDNSNTDEHYLRNRLRRRLVPVLNEFFPFWKIGLSKMAETQAYTAEFIVENAKNLVKWDIEKNKKGSLKVLCLSTDADNFFARHQIIREESIFQAVNILFKGKPGFSPRRSAIRQFAKGGKKAIDLGFVRICQKEGKIFAVRPRKFFECGVLRLIK